MLAPASSQAAGRLPRTAAPVRSSVKRKRTSVSAPSTSSVPSSERASKSITTPSLTRRDALTAAGFVSAGFVVAAFVSAGLAAAGAGAGAGSLAVGGWGAALTTPIATTHTAPKAPRIQRITVSICCCSAGREA